MVRLYSQPTCGMCKALHIQLDKAGIEYEEIQDLGAMAEKGIKHTPTLETEDGKLLQGADAIRYVRERSGR